AGKRIMKFLGIDLGINRTPFQNVTDEEETIIRKELEAIGFFERCNRI
ncbi:MAG: N-acetylneuraminate lyase, partial [Fermentimonas sp.]|nr:N-acetylneuraminate lyase [Fermentimonas sp.]MDD3188588.1 N-acetylneuraminate lyase [Fermentimonas sp.]